MLALLILPFLLVASAIVIHQSVRTLQSYIAVIAAPDMELAPLPPRTASRISMTAPPISTATERHPDLAELTPVSGPPAAPRVELQGRDAVVATAPQLGAPASALTEAIAPLASAPQLISAAPEAGLLAASKSIETEIAFLAPALRPSGPAAPPQEIEGIEADEDGNPILRGICAIEQPARPQTTAATVMAFATPLDREAFGLHLAKAAESQVGAFVVYNDAYRRIAYPMGDVPAFFGVCTDVIVRAYRTLGVDLQMLVHKARSGRGDTNIDHRRTEVLRRFFATHGESLPITSFPENYRPGDIVTYHRPQNQRSRSHIAVVSSVIAPSGRPMIVHNRGWGPQLEDALFVDQITGHYRYTGPQPTNHADLAPAGGASRQVVTPASLSAADLDTAAIAE